MWRHLAQHDAPRPWWAKLVLRWVAASGVDPIWRCMALVACWLIACVWSWWLMCKAGLGCHDDVQSNAVCKDWATRCYPNTWTNANGMGSYIVYVLYMDMLC